MSEIERSQALNNIPNKKLLDILASIDSSADEQDIKVLKNKLINRYYEANVPVEYWFIKMEKDFVGDKRLLDKYNEYIKDLKESYISGKSICFAGANGRGKSFTSSCILKKASEKGFNCLYTTLSDVISVLLNSKDSYIARRELLMVDFLCVDEVDPRFMANENASDLYARTLETIFRTRAQNKLPTLMCTNSPNLIESFNGSLKISLNSLFKGYMEMFSVFGPDYRINK